MHRILRNLLVILIIILVGSYGYFSYQINTDKYKHPLDPSLANNTAVLSESGNTNKYKEFFSQFVSLDLITVDLSSFADSKVVTFIEDKVLPKKLITRQNNNSDIYNSLKTEEKSVSENLEDLNNLSGYNLTKVTNKTSQFNNTLGTKPQLKLTPTN